MPRVQGRKKRRSLREYREISVIVAGNLVPGGFRSRKLPFVGNRIEP